MSFRDKLIGLAFLLALVLVPTSMSASIGVGVGVGKIQVDKPLRSGQVYKIGTLPVINTGTETSDYEVTVEFHEGIKEIWPNREWFKFEPQTFTLEPNEIKNVQVTMTLPLKTQPGDYFAYLEGHPTKKSSNGITSVGIAAASKLYFSVAPANFFAGIYYRIQSIIVNNSPWSYVVLGVIGFIILMKVLGRFVSLNLNIKVKNKK